MSERKFLRFVRFQVNERNGRQARWGVWHLTNPHTGQPRCGCFGIRDLAKAEFKDDLGKEEHGCDMLFEDVGCSQCLHPRRSLDPAIAALAKEHEALEAAADRLTLESQYPDTPEAVIHKRVLERERRKHIAVSRLDRGLPIMRGQPRREEEPV